MPLWPFGRKKRRTSTSSQTVGVEAEVADEKRRVLDDPRRHTESPTQTSSARPLSRRDSQRKRKASSNRDQEKDRDGERNGATSATHEKKAEQQQQQRRLRKTSVQDITALPDMRGLESSPHLRPVNACKPVIPYSLDRGSPAARVGVSSPRADHSSSSPAHGLYKSTRASPPQGRKSDRRKEQALREEEIRAMSAPMQIPKRPAAVSNDLLRRDSKKARRTFSSKQRSDDHRRGSTVSIPLSIPSSMSAASEQRGWLVGGIDLLNPRPTVRLSIPGYYPPPNVSAAGLSRKGSNKGKKLPAIAQETSTKDRRKVADLADDLGSSDLRTVLERDARRKEQKVIEQQNRLERKLRKRAEKQRAEEDEDRQRANNRSSNNGTDRAPPNTVHPAFRDAALGAADTQIRPLTPESIRHSHDDTVTRHDQGRRSEGGTYLRYPARQDIPQNPFDDPVLEDSPFADPQSETSNAVLEDSPFVDPQPETSNPVAEHWSPVQTPLEEPVIHTARAVRLSQGHLSPPTSPLARPQASESLSELSDLQTQRSTSISQPPVHEQRRGSESSPRRAGTWASIFRRGGPSTSRTSVDNAGKVTPSEGSFANVSRESMSRQAIPPHLINQSGRRSATPARTQSRFREDLPDAPMSPPDSRVQSPDLPLAAGTAIATRQSKRAAGPHHRDSMSNSAELASLGRTDSPVVFEEDEEHSELPISQSLASIDSEGSWISGRPVQRMSTQPLQRDSTASAASVSVEKQMDDFSGSYERLPIPEHEYFSALTPNAGSRHASNETAPPSTGMNTTPTAPADAGEQTAEDNSMPLRHGIAHRRPTVVHHNEQRIKSREGLVAEYMAGAPITPSRTSSASESVDQSPMEHSTVQSARSVNYGYGHAKSLSAGSAKLLNIPPSRSDSRRASPASGSPALMQSEF